MIHYRIFSHAIMATSAAVDVSMNVVAAVLKENADFCDNVFSPYLSFSSV